MPSSRRRTFLPSGRSSSKRTQLFIRNKRSLEMKRAILSAVTCCFVGLGLAACTDHAKDSKSDQPTTRPSSSEAPTTRPVMADSGTPINKFCAVNRDEEIDPKVTTTYNGKTTGFCCDTCIPKL